MINIHTLKIYNQYDGWYDGYVLKNNEEPINNDQWLLVDDLVSEGLIVFRGLASSKFKNIFFDKINKTFDSKETVSFFYEILLKKLKK